MTTGGVSRELDEKIIKRDFIKPFDHQEKIPFDHQEKIRKFIANDLPCKYLIYHGIGTGIKHSGCVQYSYEDYEDYEDHEDYEGDKGSECHIDHTIKNESSLSAP